MGVIRHEAVRENFKPFLSRCLPKLRQRVRHRRRIDEEVVTPECAKREEIAVAAFIAEARNPRRARHGACK
jgi:hypothetical protein